MGNNLSENFLNGPKLNFYFKLFFQKSKHFNFNFEFNQIYTFFFVFLTIESWTAYNLGNVL